MSNYISPNSHEGAVQIAVQWLSSLHRKGWQNAYQNILLELLTKDELSKLSNYRDAIEGLDINLNEWLLAEGEIHARGSIRRINEYLLSPSGPTLNPGQRNFLHELGQRPLRLYDVTDVIKGQQMTLCDAIKKDAEPMVVMERSGTQNLNPGDLLGCRIVRLGDQFQMSGSGYLFAMLRSASVVDKVKECSELYANQWDAPLKLSKLIMKEWVNQWLEPAPMPTLMDRYSGEPIELVTDYYRVLDRPALEHALGSQPDVEGSSKEGWARMIHCTDDQVRSSLNIHPGKKSDQIEVFYTTQGYANEGREWFNALAGLSVKFTKSITKNASEALEEVQKVRAIKPTVPDIDAATMEQMVSQMIAKTYANWADEPIPALEHKTPREAIKTSAGKERVKGLLRSYESHESVQAAQQGRSPISYDFLWQSLGLNR